jgi:beta-galactosidase
MVTLTSQGLNVNGATVPVYSGTVHYWRHAREAWSHILDQCKALGFNMIETYLPWGIHEIKRGEFDFGAHDPRKDVEAFMALCEAKGLWLLARPGPLINAELTDFGFPGWVLMDSDVQARTAVGSIHFDAAWGLHPPHQFPMPSYASEKFYAYVAEWFDVICPLMARHLPTTQTPAGGCIVAVQSDNETCYLFHDQPYATDYSAASLTLYQDFLIKKYGDLSAINTAHHAHYASLPAINPPRDCELRQATDLPRHLDWIAYKEFQIIYTVSRVARMLRQRGIADVPLFHDVAFQYRTLLDLSRMEAAPHIDWVGMNLYRNVDDYGGLVKRLRFLSGATRLPFVP